ncbi:MAG TPA: DUF1573 domain-containing protein [Blastocatellia bacterium]|nr:DUF1573 domain-containing protein [Blastocatellia bacterium]
MKFQMTIAALAVALFFVTGAAGQEKKSNDPPAVPKLLLESFSHDFGQVKAGTPLKFSFKIKNDGKSDLLIKSVNPG